MNSQQQAFAKVLDLLEDAEAIANLFPLLNRQDVRIVMDSLSKRKRARAVEFMEAHDLEL